MEPLWNLVSAILGGALGATAAWLLDTRHILAVHKLGLEVRKVEREFEEAGERIGNKAYDHARKRIDAAHPKKVAGVESEANGGDVPSQTAARPTPAEIMRLWRSKR